MTPLLYSCSSTCSGKLFELKNVSCECDRLNYWNSALQAAWYVRHARWECLLYISLTMQNGVCELNLRYGCQYSVPRVLRKAVRRVLPLILMKDIGRWPFIKLLQTRQLWVRPWVADIIIKVCKLRDTWGSILPLCRMRQLCDTAACRDFFYHDKMKTDAVTTTYWRRWQASRWSW